jgi:putative transposase
MENSNKIQRRSLRMKDYDYSREGAYFLTICTYERRQLFGEIHNGEMNLYSLGRVVAAQWQRLPDRFPNLELGEWVIMPNHIHGILVITGRGEASQEKRSTLPDTLKKDASPLRPTGTTPGSVSAIIQNFKSITSCKVSTQINKLQGSVWQRNYYEHVIRNEREFQAISDYILTNPQNWEKDTEFIG